MIDEMWHFVHAKKYLRALDIDLSIHRTPLPVLIRGGIWADAAPKI